MRSRSGTSAIARTVTVPEGCARLAGIALLSFTAFCIALNGSRADRCHPGKQHGGEPYYDVRKSCHFLTTLRAFDHRRERRRLHNHRMCRYVSNLVTIQRKHERTPCPSENKVSGSTGQRGVRQPHKPDPDVRLRSTLNSRYHVHYRPFVGSTTYFDASVNEGIFKSGNNLLRHTSGDGQDSGGESGWEHRQTAACSGDLPKDTRSWSTDTPGLW